MYEIIDLNGWKEHKEEIAGGTRQKTWMKKEAATVLFKVHKYQSSETWAEKLASEIDKLIGFNMMEVHFASRNGVIGVALTNFVNRDLEKIYDGAEILGKYIENFVPDNLDDYTIENIILCLDKEKVLNFVIDKLIELLVFDILIGNQDRHSENWAIIKDDNGLFRLAPIYDNGSSLGFMLKEDLLLKYINKEKSVKAFNSRSKTLIGVNGNRKPKSKELFFYLKENFSKQVTGVMSKIENLNENEIDYILNSISCRLMTNIQKKFVKEMLLTRKMMILEWGD